MEGLKLPLDITRHKSATATEYLRQHTKPAMDINIVGSGICGLTAAIGLRRAGHRVKIFERASTATAFGAGVVLGHNISLVLTEYGLDWKAANCNRGDGIVVYDGVKMKHLSTTDMDLAEYEPRPGIKQYLAHRVDLQHALVDLATNAGGPGQPVDIIYNANVVSYDSEQGSLTLHTGEVYTADLVVAADGVHSRAPAHLLGHEFNAKHTGTSVVRFMLPTESLRSDPATQCLLDDPGVAAFYISANREKYLLRYPLRNDTLQNFGLYTVNKKAAEIDDQVLRFTCDRESLHKELSGFHPAVLAMVDKTTEIMPVWKLVERLPMPTWHRAKLLTVGDAAHPMLPNQGQGAGMAVEDAAALGVILQNMPPHPSEQQLEDRLLIFEKVRKPRASVVQLLSSVPYFENGMQIMLPKLLEHMSREQLPGLGGPKDVRPWFYKYDVFKESERALAAATEMTST